MQGADSLTRLEWIPMIYSCLMIENDHIKRTSDINAMQNVYIQ